MILLLLAVEGEVHLSESITRSDVRMIASDGTVFQAIWLKKALHYLQVSCSSAFS